MDETIKDGIQGRVKAFFKTPGYGFMVPLDKDGRPRKDKKGRPQSDVHFHMTDSREVYETSQGTVGWKHHERKPNEQLRRPEVGEILVYDRKQDDKGVRARFWTFKDLMTLARIRITMSSFRIVDAYGNVVWSGDYSTEHNLIESSQLLPVMLANDQWLEQFVFVSADHEDDTRPKTQWRVAPSNIFATLRRARVLDAV